MHGRPLSHRSSHHDIQDALTSHVSTRTIGTMSIVSSLLKLLDLVVGTLLAVQVDPKNLSTSHTTYIKQRKMWGDFQVKIGGTY